MISRVARVSAIFPHFCVDGDVSYSDFTWDGEASKEGGMDVFAMKPKESWLEMTHGVEFGALCTCVCICVASDR